MRTHEIAGMEMSRDWSRFTEASTWIVDGKLLIDLEVFLLLERKIDELNRLLQASEQ